MRKIIINVITGLLIGFYTYGQDISPYIKVGASSETIQSVTKKAIACLKDNGFAVLGDYNPSGKSTLRVVAFTRNDIKATVIKVEDRGALAAVFKIGFEMKSGKVIISYTNPDYLLRAYLMDDYDRFKSTFEKFSANLKTALSPLGNEFSPFGGTVEAQKLKKYHYKIMMPYFTDPIELAEFNSFKEGVALIEENLKAKKGQTKLVYKLIYPEEQVAVFGIGLQNTEEGESYFLPRIGEAHLAALPYEIILQGKEVTMLHGKYRIALFWPELTMGTFMKIMSTPGDIEDALEAVCR